jgi:outer membrane protein TolC
MGEPAGAVWQLTGTIQEKDRAARDAAVLIQDAFEARPDLKAADLKLKAGAVELSRQKATALPRLSAFADATNNRRDIKDAGGNNFTVGVKAGISLFDPSRSGRVKEAAAVHDRLAQDVLRLKDEITRAIAEETARHEALRDNAPVLKGMSEDAGEVVTLTAPLYSEGRKSVADLMEARQAYLQTVQAHEKALMGVWMSEGRLLFLTGHLNELTMQSLAEEGGL